MPGLGLGIGTHFAALSAPGSGATGLLQHWEFEEGSGTVVGATVGIDGTTNGTWPTGVVGSNASGHNGTSHFVVSDSAINYGSAQIITVAFWLHLASTGDQVLLESSTNFNASGDHPGRWVIRLEGGSLAIRLRDGVAGEFRQETYTPPSPGVWNHIAVVFDNSTASGAFSYYLNAALQTTGDPVGDNKTGSGPFDAQKLYVASRGGASLWSDSSIDDLRIYEEALSVGEISTLEAMGTAAAVDLSWTAAAAGGPTADATRVEWGTDGVTFPYSQEEAAGATSASVAGLTPASTYYFRIVRYNDAGDSDASNTLTVNT